MAADGRWRRARSGLATIVLGAAIVPSGLLVLYVSVTLSHVLPRAVGPAVIVVVACLVAPFVVERLRIRFDRRRRGRTPPPYVR